MHFLRVSLAKDVQRLLRDPASLATSLLIPVVVGLLIRLVSSGGGTPTATMLVADHDQSFGSSFLLGTMSQGPAADLIDVEMVEEQAGRERMENGEASGLLIIPEGFGSDVLNQERTTLSLITNPSQRIKPGILKEYLETLVDVVNGARNILGDSVDPLIDQTLAGDGVPPDAVVAQISVAINQLAQRAEPYLFPPVITVQTIIQKDKAKSRSMGEIFFPTIIFMGVIFVAQSLSGDIWTEKMSGTLQRTLATPGRLGTFLLGKILAGGLVMAAVALVAITLGRVVFSLPFQNLPVAMIWTMLSGMLMLILFTVIQLLAASQKGGNLLTSAVLFPLLMGGGAFFPLESMPDDLARIGKWTPNGWALVQLKEILADTLTGAELLMALGVLLTVILLLLVICQTRLSGFARS